MYPTNFETPNVYCPTVQCTREATMAMFDHHILVVTAKYSRVHIPASIRTLEYLGWPQQPPTERISDISEKLDF